MKLAITSQAEGIESALDPSFGRAKYFVIVDLGTNAVKTASNFVNLNADQGAGIQAARAIIDLGVKALITSHIGAKAFAVLWAGGVTIYSATSGTGAEALEQFKAGTLKTMASADVEGDQ